MKKASHSSRRDQLQTAGLKVAIDELQGTCKRIDDRCGFIEARHRAIEEKLRSLLGSLDSMQKEINTMRAVSRALEQTVAAVAAKDSAGDESFSVTVLGRGRVKVSGLQVEGVEDADCD